MSSADPENMPAFEVCVIPSDLRETCRPKTAILERLERAGFPEEETFGIKLALEEALTNAVKHGNNNDSSKQITIKYAITPDKAIITVRDEGPGFEPEKVPDCTAPDRLPLPNGRGIMLIRSYMDEVYYRDQGREICFVKNRTK